MIRNYHALRPDCSTRSGLHARIKLPIKLREGTTYANLTNHHREGVAVIFKTNEIIVCDDAPAGAIVVDGYDPQRNLLARPLVGGFQLSIPPMDHSRLDVVLDEERTPIFTRAKFSLEGLEESVTGWTDGKHWNGWAMPRFEFTDAQRLIAALGQDVGKYDPGTDSFITTMEAREPENWTAEITHLPDGGTVKVYPIGAGSWIWEQEDGS